MKNANSSVLLKWKTSFVLWRNAHRRLHFYAPHSFCGSCSSTSVLTTGVVEHFLGWPSKLPILVTTMFSEQLEKNFLLCLCDQLYCEITIGHHHLQKHVYRSSVLPGWRCVWSVHASGFNTLSLCSDSLPSCIMNMTLYRHGLVRWHTFVAILNHLGETDTTY